jgi:uncharacterized protein (TIGR02246 family)
LGATVDRWQGCGVGTLGHLGSGQQQPAVVVEEQGISPSPLPCARCSALTPSVVMATFAHPRDLADAFAQALNAKDVDELGELFTDDAEFVNIMGMRMRRREGIVDGHGWAFAGPLRGRRVHFDQIDELSVTDDVIVLIGHCVREREPDGPVAGLPDGASVLVFVTRREPQSWRIVAATNVTESTPPPG